MKSLPFRYRQFGVYGLTNLIMGKDIRVRHCVTKMPLQHFVERHLPLMFVLPCNKTHALKRKTTSEDRCCRQPGGGHRSCLLDPCIDNGAHIGRKHML